MSTVSLNAVPLTPVTVEGQGLVLVEARVAEAAVGPVGIDLEHERCHQQPR